MCTYLLREIAFVLVKALNVKCCRVLSNIFLELKVAQINERPHMWLRRDK